MIMNFGNIKPQIDKDSFVAESADVIGNVVLEKGTNIWFGAVLRGDSNKIFIGENTNIQDNAVVHVDEDYETIVGKNVTVGHNAIVHGCVVEENCLIGMGAILLNGCKIGKNSIVAAGSLVAQNKVIPEGVLCMGSPAKVIRELTKEEIEGITKSADGYVANSKLYK